MVQPACWHSHVLDTANCHASDVHLAANSPERRWTSVALRRKGGSGKLPFCGLLVGGWALPHVPFQVLWIGIPTPLKNDGVSNSWDDFPFPTGWKVIKAMFQSPPTSLQILREFLQDPISDFWCWCYCRQLYNMLLMVMHFKQKLTNAPLLRSTQLYPPPFATTTIMEKLSHLPSTLHYTLR